MLLDFTLSLLKAFGSKARARILCICRSNLLLRTVFISSLIIHSSEIKAEERTSASNLSVDVSFIIVDLKYHPERGAQICEIQHGLVSAFKGHAMWHEGHDLIAQKFMDGINGFYDTSWAAIDAFADPTIKELLHEDTQWRKVTNFNAFDVNEEFQSFANLPVNDRTDLSKYHGFVYMSPLTNKGRDRFQNKYPGFVLVDNAFYGYVSNKYKMTELLMGHPLTEKHKPKWGIYDKNDTHLAEKINRQIGSDILVIKPTDEYKGVGVIIVRKEELKSVLGFLFDKKDRKTPCSDPAYAYWKKGKASKFIVEEFIEVVPATIAHLDGKLYSPTMRLAFLLFYNKEQITINCLGGYYTLPRTALSDPGSLNEHYKSCVCLPYYSKADPEIMKLAESEITEVLKIIYQKLLKI